MTSKYRSRRAGQAAHSTCRQCGREPTEDNPLSLRLLCAECAWENMSATGRQIQAREGPHYEEWRRRSLEAAMREAGITT